MTDERLRRIRELIQVDVNQRGLRAEPGSNLVTACAGDLHAACRSLAAAPHGSAVVFTGFFIAHGQPPCAETDGPLGAAFLARALTPLGISVALAGDRFVAPALQAGLAAAGLGHQVPVHELPPFDAAQTMGPEAYRRWFQGLSGSSTHWIFLERVGPSHTPETIQAQPGSSATTLARFLAEVPPERHDRCQSMRGRDITRAMSPVHWLLEGESFHQQKIRTIGIGDGGNEMGMGKIPWEIIARNVPGGGPIACRVATDDLIVCGISNWGAYGLGAGTRTLRAAAPDSMLFDPREEQRILQAMVDRGPLVDGMSGLPTLTVDGLEFDRYVQVLKEIGAV